MTTRSGPREPSRLTTVALPWLIGAAGLVVFWITVNPWVSLLNIGNVARVCGWTWQFTMQEPLNAVLFLPFRGLPRSWTPPALNWSAALAAALTLALLARSVALLPHDRTRSERRREFSDSSALSIGVAWSPPVLAAIACALNLSFWEHATSGSGEMVVLLVFAATIWCLLEFRVSRRRAWLAGAVLLYGAGMANHWLFLGYLPVFLAALLRLDGVELLGPRFLGRTVLWSLAAFSLYLLLPYLASCAYAMHINFWPALKANLHFQREALRYFPTRTLPPLAFTCWLPLLLISIRWKSPLSPDEDRKAAEPLNKRMFNVVQIALLGISLWLVLDPPFSPRNLHLGTLAVTQNYLSAIVIGYCAGYLLLLGTVHASRLQTTITLGAFALLLVALPLVLVARNLGQIKLTNGPALRGLARQLCGSLPKGNFTVLSDGPVLLLLAQAQLVDDHERNALLLDTHFLPFAGYHIFMADSSGSRWPVEPLPHQPGLFSPAQLTELLQHIATNEPVVYLHPSYGYYFERFTDRPRGLVNVLVPRYAAPVSPAHEAPDINNATFWEDLWTNHLQAIAGQFVSQGQGVRPGSRALESLQLVGEINSTLSFLTVTYAKSLDDWGARCQRQGDWQTAARWFRRALELNPDNIAARINLEFNELHQSGAEQQSSLRSFELRYPSLNARYRSLESARYTGPVDEPSFLLYSADQWLWGGNYHQATTEFARVAELEPAWPEPTLGLALVNLLQHDFTRALQFLDKVQASGMPRDNAGLAQFGFCRSTALQGLGRTNEAALCLDRFIQQHEYQAEVLAATEELFGRSLRRIIGLPPAAPLLARMLARDPYDPGLLLRFGNWELLQHDDAAASNTLSRVLSLDKTNALNRLQALSQLAEIACRANDINAAKKYCERGLSEAPPKSDEAIFFAQRLKQLRGKQPSAN